MVALALPIGWLATEMKQAREQRAVVEEVGILKVTYDWQRPGTPGIETPLWLRRLLGYEFFSEINILTLQNVKVTDATLKRLKGLKRLYSLSLAQETEINDAQLMCITGLDE